MLAVQRFSAIGAIDTAFRIYRAHFGLLFLISLMVNVPITLVSVVATYLRHLVQTDAISMQDVPAELVDVMPALIIAGTFVATMAVSLIASMFGTAAATQVASRIALGQQPDLSESIAAAIHVFWPLFGATLLTALASSVGMLLCCVPGIIIAIGLLFIAPVIVVEKQGATDALARSWELTKGRRLKILGTLTLIGLITLGAWVGLAIVIATVADLQGSLLGEMLQSVGGQVISALVTPISYVAIVLLYYDARVDREAFDVELLARSEA